jgi:hypothetical protein
MDLAGGGEDGLSEKKTGRCSPIYVRTAGSHDGRVLADANSEQWQTLKNPESTTVTLGTYLEPPDSASRRRCCTIQIDIASRANSWLTPRNSSKTHRIIRR